MGSGASKNSPGLVKGIKVRVQPPATRGRGRPGGGSSVSSLDVVVSKPKKYSIMQIDEGGRGLDNDDSDDDDYDIPSRNQTGNRNRKQKRGSLVGPHPINPYLRRGGGGTGRRGDGGHARSGGDGDDIGNTRRITLARPSPKRKNLRRGRDSVRVEDEVEEEGRDGDGHGDHGPDDEAHVEVGAFSNVGNIKVHPNEDRFTIVLDLLKKFGDAGVPYSGTARR